jgi:hypothetical protein
MLSIRRILAPALIIGSGLIGCLSNHKPTERTEAVNVYLEKADEKVSKEVVISRLASHGRYLAQRDIGSESNFEFKDAAEKYYQDSSGKSEEYISFLISKSYLEESRKNNAISKERYDFFNALFNAYLEQDLISHEDLPSLGEIRNAIYEKEYIDSAYACWVIDEKEYAWFNSQKWIEGRRPFNEVKKMLTNLTSAAENNISEELRAAFVFSEDYNVANKIFEVYSKGLLDEKTTIELLAKSNDYLPEFPYNYLSGMRAHFLLKYVFPIALEKAKDSGKITLQQYNDIFHRNYKTMLQDEKDARHFSLLGAQNGCLGAFKKLGFFWEKTFKFEGPITMAQLAYPFHEPFDDNFNEMVFTPPSYNNQKDQPQVLSGN